MTRRRRRMPGFLHRLVRVESQVPAEGDEVVRVRSSVRVAWVGGFIALGYTALVLQAARLMLVPDPQLESKARVQFEEAVEVRGRRGDILARDGSVLATTVDLYTLHVDPSRVPPAEAETIARTLAPLLGQPEAWVRERLSRSDRRDVRLARGLTPGEVAQVRKALPGGVVWGRAEPTRFYPGRGDGVHLVGVTGRSGVGAAGVERTYDRLLRGGTHKFVQWRDRKGRSLNIEAPTASPGHTLVLTLHPGIQRLAEAALDSAMERTGAEAAHMTVLHVKTGDVLAMVSRPTMNPNETDTLSMDDIKNHAVMDTFEPGSVFKPFVAAAALEEGLVTPESIVDCEGGRWRVQNKVITDDHPHGAVSLAEVIKYSSNIGAAKLAFQLGADKTLDYLADFGFGRPVGLDLPGETRGMMRKADDIRPIELATTSYGHGVTASGLQLAAAIAALGNGGVRMEPRLLMEVRDEHGTVVESHPPRVDRRVVSEEVADQSVAMMELVTQVGGTGTRARVEGYRVAGKTGTAWKVVDGAYSSTARIGSWVGLIPADDPVLAVAVSIDTPTIGSKYGGIVAAPPFAEMAAGAMRLLGVPPDPTVYADANKAERARLAALEQALNPPVADVEPAPVDEPVPTAPLARDATWTPDGKLRAPDLVGLSLRDALALVSGSGLGLELQGSGRVVEQIPPPGAPVLPGTQVRTILQ